jgi:hypothetical protein
MQTKGGRSPMRCFRPRISGFSADALNSSRYGSLHPRPEPPSLPRPCWPAKFCLGFPKLPVLCSSLTSAGSSIFVSPTIYRFRGTQQISLGNAKRLCSHPVAITPTAPTNIGSLSLPADSPSMDALRHFAFARYGCSPTASSGLPLTGIRFPFGPRIGLVLQVGALASSVSDSLRQGSGLGLAPFGAHLQSSGHASHTGFGRFASSTLGFTASRFQRWFPLT